MGVLSNRVSNPIAQTRHGTLEADTSLVEFDEDFTSIEVLNRSSETIWVVIDPVDDSDITVGADGTEVVPAMTSAIFKSPSRALSRVKLYAEATADYSLRAE